MASARLRSVTVPVRCRYKLSSSGALKLAPTVRASLDANKAYVTVGKGRAAVSPNVRVKARSLWMQSTIFTSVVPANLDTPASRSRCSMRSRHELVWTREKMSEALVKTGMEEEGRSTTVMNGTTQKEAINAAAASTYNCIRVFVDVEVGVDIGVDIGVEHWR